MIERKKERQIERDGEREREQSENFKRNLLNVERETSKKVLYLFEDDLIEIKPKFLVKFCCSAILSECIVHHLKKFIDFWQIVERILKRNLKQMRTSTIIRMVKISEYITGDHV